MVFVYVFLCVSVCLVVIRVCERNTDDCEIIVGTEEVVCLINRGGTSTNASTYFVFVKINAFAKYDITKNVAKLLADFLRSVIKLQKEIIFRNLP